MTESRADLGWLITVSRVPAKPSRHRVAIWRELRRIGAVSPSGGTWAVPVAPVFAEGLAKVGEQVDRGGGTMPTVDARPRGETDALALLAEFNATRAEEWREFVSEVFEAYAEELYSAAHTPLGRSD